jgi:hypothetical protein
MSFNRYAKRPDSVTDSIVRDLRKAGFDVTFIGLPVDLLVRHGKWGANAFKLLEVKSERKKRSGEVKLDKRQQDQAEFCAKHGVPYVTSTFEALLALGEKVDL